VVATDGREWLVHRVAGAAAEAAHLVLRGAVGTVNDELGTAARAVDLVVVDVPPGRIGAAMRTVSAVIGSARLVAVDEGLLHRFGTHRPLPPLSPVIEGFEQRRARRWPWLVMTPVLVLGVASAVAFTRPHAGSFASAVVGGVPVEIPDDWRRTELTGEPAPRVVFVEPGTGSRIVVALSPLRAGATPESVAASLAERIRQRGDDAVSDFAARAEFAGQTVIAYRETPDSGAPIRWYVRVIEVDGRGTSQVSVGCQDSGAAEFERECRRAVASV
jgi:type VII secretion-associated protein (TIGR03931 family)